MLAPNVFSKNFDHVDAFRDQLALELSLRLQAAREDADDLWRHDNAKRMMPLTPAHAARLIKREEQRQNDPAHLLARERVLHQLPGLRRPTVGQAVEVNPYYAGGVGYTNIAPYNPMTGVGAPVEQVAPAAGAPPVQVNMPAWQVGGNSLLGLGYRVLPAATDATNLQTLFDTRGTLRFNVKPFRPFNPGYLWSPSTTIDTLIDMIKIQGIEVFSAEEVVPIEIFSEVSRIREMQWLTIQESSGVSMDTSNPTAQQQLFKGAFWGAYVRQ